MAAPSRVTTNGVTPVGLGGLTGVQDEVHSATTFFAVEDFSFEPKRTHRDTMDADEAITMRKSVTPQATITMKGKVKAFTSGSLIVQEAGTSITTTIGTGTLSLSNFAAAGINGYIPSDGLIILDSIKFSQKRLITSLEADLQLTHLPHAA